MTHEIQKADPQAKRNALILMGAAVLLATFVSFLLKRVHEPLLEWIFADELALKDRLNIVLSGLFLFFLPLVFCGIYVMKQAGRIIRAARYPAPGMKTIRDSVVLTGEEALRKGKLMQFLALVMIFNALLMPSAFAWVCHQFLK